MIYIIFLLCFNFHDIFCATTSINNTTAYDYEQNYIFNAIQFPLTDITDSFTLNIFSNIDTIFGPNGLNFNTTNIEIIKKAYLYLIFLTKLELLINNPQFQKYQNDFGDLSVYQNDVMPLIPTQAIVTSSGWQSVTISGIDIQNSLAWQLFCKAQVCDAYAYLYVALDMMHNSQKDIFNYIPHIETSYYDYDFTQLRNLNEVTRIKTILELTSQQYFLNQINDWKDLATFIPATATAPQNNLLLNDYIIAFKKTEFYQTSHNVYKLLGLSNNAPISIANLSSPTPMAVPIKELVWNFFLLNEVLTMIYGTMNTQTLENVLTLCSNSSLQPNIFPYTIDDYVYFNDLIALRCKINGSVNQSTHPNAPATKIEDLTFGQAPDAHVQWWPASWVVSAADAVAHTVVNTADTIANDAVAAWSDVKSAADSAYDAAKSLGESIGDGVAGLGASLAGYVTEAITFGAAGQSLISWGDTEQQQAVSDIATATTDLQNSISDIASAVKEGMVAPLSQIQGNIVTLVTGDTELGESVTSVISQVSDALVDVQAAVTSNIITQTLQGAAIATQLGTTIVQTIGATVSSVTDPANASQNWKNLFSLTTTGILSSMSGLWNATYAVLTSIMQAMTAITTSITTIFINLVREITYLASLAWNVEKDIVTNKSLSQALSQADYDRDNVTNTLNKHREVINQCVGVAMAIGFTVATAGVGAEAAAGEIAAEETASDISAEITQETASTAGEATTTTTETAAEQATTQAEEETESAAQKALRLLKNNKLLVFNIGMNTAFGVFNVLQANNSDNQNILNEMQQAQQISDFYSFVNDMKLSTAQAIYDELKELELKQQASIGNGLIGLSFVKNNTNAQINSIVKQLQKSLAQNYITQLTQTNGSMQADIGSTWGLSTNYLDLCPTEGFTSATKGRHDFPFAQEVAQAPFVITPTTTTTTTSITPAIKKQKKPTLWINQKSIALDNLNTNGQPKQPTDPLTVSLDIQFLYTLNTPLYVGIYMGGTYYDYTSSQYLTDLQQTKIADINAQNLSKCVVLFRNNPSDQLSIGVYEYGGLEWIYQTTLPETAQLDDSHTYQLQATLNGDTLSISLSVDNNIKAPITQSVTVTPIDNQRTYGVIYSGAAIQWNQLAPTRQNNVNRSLRPSTTQAPDLSHAISEINREQTSKRIYLQSLNPSFGNMTLQPVSQTSIMLGNYLYTTTSTNLQQYGAKLTNDYVVFANNDGTQTTDIGIHPPLTDTTLNPNALVSVITGNVYNEQGNVIGQCNNVWQNYSKTYLLNQSVSSYIQQAQQVIQSKLSQITFGSYNFNIISQTALNNGQYIYSCNQTLNLKDADGNPIPDYVIFVELDGNDVGSMIGLPPTSANATGFISLVSCNLYAKTTPLIKGQLPTPIATGECQLGNYQNTVTIDPSDLSLITTATTAWQTQETAEQKANKKSKKTATLNQQTTTTGNIAPTNTGGLHLNPHPGGIHLGPPNQNKITSLQKNAASSTGFQIGGGKGISLKIPHSS